MAKDVAGGQVVNSPGLGQAAQSSPIAPTYEVARFADPDALIEHEAGSVALHSRNQPARRARAVLLLRRTAPASTSGGVKIARPNRRYLPRWPARSHSGPDRGWNMARCAAVDESPWSTTNHAKRDTQPRHQHCRAASTARSGDGPFGTNYLATRTWTWLDRQGLRGSDGEGCRPCPASRVAGAPPAKQRRGQQAYLIDDCREPAKGVGWAQNQGCRRYVVAERAHGRSKGGGGRGSDEKSTFRMAGEKNKKPRQFL